MNCPSKTVPLPDDDWNQSPNALAADLTTRSDLGQIANARRQRNHRLEEAQESPVEMIAMRQPASRDKGKDPSLLRDGGASSTRSGSRTELSGSEREPASVQQTSKWRKSATPPTGDGVLAERTFSRLSSRDDVGQTPAQAQPTRRACWRTPNFPRPLRRIGQVLARYAKFVGPGFMVSVAYIDPGNYATDVSAGATYRFKLLFMILLSNLFAIYLQALCIKLGSVTGMNLAEMCKAHMPPWLNLVMYFFAECAIIATDIAEVIGTAISLNLLLHVPLVAGCAISIVDVLVILFFYRPNSGSMRGLRAFEIFVMLLVLGVVICFCVQLSLIKGIPVGEVFKGYLPSSALVQGKGLYQACGILGATVMPHSLYLGSGIIQARLKDFDKTNDNLPEPRDEDPDEPEEKYRPSLSAIRSCLSYSIVELAISLFTFALFVNSAILIVAGASLYDVSGADNADLFGIYHLLSRTMAPAAGTIFALALLLSGTSAGIVCTIAGQMVSEGQLSWSMKPWLRRLMTRSISITPSIIIAGAVGAEGLSAALEGSQVALSVILPFVSAPLIYFTCRNKYMTVATREGNGDQLQEGGNSIGHQAENGMGQGSHGVKMRNHWVTSTVAVLIWGVIVVMNIALLVLLGLGVD